jgi:hypothetical protein
LGYLASALTWSRLADFADELASIHIPEAEFVLPCYGHKLPIGMER